MESTLCIIKPNAIRNSNIGEIITSYEKESFSIRRMKLTYISKSEAEEFYAEHSERPFFNSLVQFMTSGPIIIMILEGANAVERNRAIMGATNPEEADQGTIRNLYGDSLEENSVHGSDSQVSARREITFFFSDYFAQEDIPLAA